LTSSKTSNANINTFTKKIRTLSIQKIAQFEEEEEED
jgi:hypothetical protein